MRGALVRVVGGGADAGECAGAEVGLDVGAGASDRFVVKGHGAREAVEVVRGSGGTIHGAEEDGVVGRERIGEALVVVEDADEGGGGLREV